MGVSGAVFESAGKRTVHWVPGVYSRRNTIAGGSGALGNNLVIMGQSVGGMPRTMIACADATEARELLVGGQLLDAVVNAFNGSGDFVPQQVYAFRVNNGTRAVLELKSGDTTIVEVKSKDYGVHTNQIKLWVRNGSAAGSKKITVSYKGNEVEADNIIRKSFSVLYTGSGTNPRANITAEGMTLQATGPIPGTKARETVRFTNTTGAVVTVPAGSYSLDDGVKTWSYTLPTDTALAPGGTQDITVEADTVGVDANLTEGLDIASAITPELPAGITAVGMDAVQGTDPATGAIDALAVTWEECDTLEDLVSRINDTGVYAATLIDVRPNVKTSDLDTVANVALTPVAATFYSNLAAFAETLSSMQYIGDVEIVSANLFVVPDNNESFVYFSGATPGSYTVGDWADALETLEEEDVQSIATPSTDHDVRILISNHITSMCQTEKRKERQGIFGLPLNTSLDDAVAAARELNSEYVSLVMDDAIASNPITGATERIDAGLLSCKIAGMEASMGMSNPLTNKVLKVNSFGRKHRTSELNTMIQSGIMPCGINEEGNLVIIRAMTTYQGDNLGLNERSCVREALYMDRDLRKAYARRIGTASEPSSAEVISVLLRKAQDWYTRGYITMSDSGELAFDINIRFDGDKTYLEYSKYLRAPNNFVFITANNLIYSSAEAA